MFHRKKKLLGRLDTNEKKKIDRGKEPLYARDSSLLIINNNTEARCESGRSDRRRGERRTLYVL